MNEAMERTNVFSSQKKKWVCKWRSGKVLSLCTVFTKCMLRPPWIGMWGETYFQAFLRKTDNAWKLIWRQRNAVYYRLLLVDYRCLTTATACGAYLGCQNWSISTRYWPSRGHYRDAGVGVTPAHQVIVDSPVRRFTWPAYSDDTQTTTTTFRRRKKDVNERRDWKQTANGVRY